MRSQALSARGVARAAGVLTGALGLVLGGGGSGLRPADAQMPDLRLMSGKPLPAAELAPGTVTVRVARKMPANPVVGVEVIAIVTNPGGDSRKRSAKTDAQGRATFDGVQPGGELQAEVTVDGERLVTQKFVIPASGGTRTMLIAGLGEVSPDNPAAGGGPTAGGPRAMGGTAGGGKGFAMGVPAGAAAPDPSVAAGTLEIHLRGEDGRPLAGKAVTLGRAASDGTMQMHQAASNESGMARFEELPTGDQLAYAAVIEHGGMRLGTEAFRMPASPGMRADIRVPAKTTDLSVLRVGEASRVIFMLREGAFEVIEILVFRNTSEKIFDTSPSGLEIPLPSGVVNAQAMDEGAGIEVREDKTGVILRAALPPGPSEIRFVYILPYTGASLDFEQTLPIAADPFTLIVEREPGMSLGGASLGRHEERVERGQPIWVGATQPIAAGDELKLSLGGLPATDSTGRNVAGVLTLLLVVGAVIASRRPDAARKSAAGARQRLSERREKLFGELVATEQARRQRRAGPDGDERRRDLVTKLEGVYRELAALDESPGA